MAKANSTPRLVREDSDSTALEIDPVTINPIIAYVNDQDECVQNVRNVLVFMGEVFRSGGVDIGASGLQGAADGAGLILETCAAALDFHTQRKGGAA